MSMMDIFRLPDDKLPTEYPWREALKIYTKQSAIFVKIAVICLLFVLYALFTLFIWNEIIVSIWDGIDVVDGIVVRLASQSLMPTFVILLLVMLLYILMVRPEVSRYVSYMSAEMPGNTTEADQRLMEGLELYYENLPAAVQKLWKAKKAVNNKVGEARNMLTIEAATEADQRLMEGLELYYENLPAAVQKLWKAKKAVKGQNED